MDERLSEYTCVRRLLSGSVRAEEAVCAASVGGAILQRERESQNGRGRVRAMGGGMRTLEQPGVETLLAPPMERRDAPPTRPARPHTPAAGGGTPELSITDINIPAHTFY